ncbi:MAG: FAD binding domain-containing protein [Bacillota bacterium]
MRNKAWFTPRTLDELQKVLAEKKAADCFICGGTDLLIACKNGKTVTGFIDLTKLPLLREVVLGNDWVFIGSAVTYDEIFGNSYVRKYLPALSKAAGQVGSQQIRNRGTLGGGVANASPASDLIPVLTCLRAAVRVLNGAGQVQEISINEFILGAGKVALAADQCILGFKIPTAKNLHTVYVKLGSRSQVTIAQITATAALYTENGKISSMDLVIGSIGPKPVSIREAVAEFSGKTIIFLDEKDILYCSAFFERYIKENVPEKFDRDYKAVAVRGVLFDLFEEIRKMAL